MQNFPSEAEQVSTEFRMTMKHKDKGHLRSMFWEISAQEPCDLPHMPGSGG
jgi:hypothetical protein